MSDDNEHSGPAPSSTTVKLSTTESSQKRSAVCGMAFFGSLTLLAGGVITALAVHESTFGGNDCGTWHVPSRLRYAIVNKAVVPPVRSFAAKHTNSYAAIAGVALLDPPSYENHSACITAWSASLREQLAVSCGSSSSPALVAIALKDAGLASNHRARAALGSLLEAPQPYNTILEQAETCAAGNIPLAAYACAALDPSNRMAPRFVQVADFDDEMCYTLNLAVMTQRLTERAVQDNQLYASIRYGLEKQLETQMDDLQNMPVSSEVKRTFFKQKVSSVNLPFGNTRGLRGGDMRMVRSTWLGVASNIVMAANFDIQSGGFMNGLLGLHLAATALVQMPDADDEDRMEYPLGDDWVYAYNAWDMIIVSRIPEALSFVAKLLIPAVGCPNFFSDLGDNATGNAELYILARAVSLKTTVTATVRRYQARSAGVYSGGVPASLYALDSEARERWAELTARHSALDGPATCGAYHSPQALLEQLHPQIGFSARPLSLLSSFTILGWHSVFRVHEDHLVEAPAFVEVMQEVCAPIVLGAIVSLLMLALECAVFATGFSSTYHVVVLEALAMIANGVPLILSFITQGFLPMLIFIILIWHLGVHVSTDRPSAMLSPPWGMPKSQRTPYLWALWVTAVWQFLHHFFFTSIKIALSFNSAHIRACSQPILLLVYISAIGAIHSAYGVQKLAHMHVISPHYALVGERCLQAGFVCRVLAAVSIAVLSRPGGPNSQGDSPMRHLHDTTWAWTHTEWWYLMIGDCIWCFGAAVLHFVFQLKAFAPKVSCEAVVEEAVLLGTLEARATDPSQRDKVLARSRDFNRWHSGRAIVCAQGVSSPASLQSRKVFTKALSEARIQRLGHREHIAGPQPPQSAPKRLPSSISEWDEESDDLSPRKWPKMPGSSSNAEIAAVGDVHAEMVIIKN